MAFGIVAAALGQFPVAVSASPAVLAGAIVPGIVWAWGANTYGQVGDGSTVHRLSPTHVAGVGSITAVSGGGFHSLAVKSDGTVWAWGSNDYGELGDGSVLQRQIPVQVQGLSGVTAVAAGDVHSLALKSDGSLWGWGDNGSGQVGDGSHTPEWHSPVQVTGLSGVTAVGAGYSHSLALKSDGTVWAWGYNGFGQVGDGTTTQYRYTPVQVVGLTGVTAISTRYVHNLALKSDGTVWAWGYNGYGGLGDGSTTDRYSPVQVVGLGGVAAIAAGDAHSLALKSDGTVWAWGRNDDFGQLGDGSTTNRTSPVQVVSVNGVTAIGAGGAHSLALRPDGTVFSWGANTYGQLGDGTTTDRHSPIQVPGLSGVDGLAAGESFSFALSPPPPPPPPAAYTAVTPVRILDTRNSGGPLGPGGSRNLTVAGVSPVPASATAAVLNVTVTNTTAASFLTIYPAGASLPLASNLNWAAGKTVPNLVEVAIGAGGAVTIYNGAGFADVVVDLEGYFAVPSGTAGGEVALTPARITDTRSGSGLANAGKTLSGGGSLVVQVTGAGSVPGAGVSGAILNVTVTNTSATGALTVWPTGAGQPLASNLNWVAGQTVPNRVFVPVGTGGKVSVFNFVGSTDVVIDVSGYFTDATAAGKQFTPASPIRLLDTRTSAQTLGPGGAGDLRVSGVAGVPSGATAVVLNITVTNTSAPSFLIAFPSTAAQPTASDLNWVGGETISNMVVATLGSTGFVTIYNGAGSTDVVVDLAGWFS